MLQITAQQRILIAAEPVDFRNGIDGLKRICQRHWNADPFSGTLFVFRNRRATDIKILSYDGNGFWLTQKRFSSGKIKWWPSTIQDAATIRAVELLIMLQQGSPKGAHVPMYWRRLPPMKPFLSAIKQPDNSTEAIVQDAAQSLSHAFEVPLNNDVDWL